MKHIIFEDTLYSLEKVRTVKLNLNYSSIDVSYEDGTFVYISFSGRSEEFMRFYFNKICEILLTK